MRLDNIKIGSTVEVGNYRGVIKDFKPSKYSKYSLDSLTLLVNDLKDVVVLNDVSCLDINRLVKNSKRVKLYKKKFLKDLLFDHREVYIVDLYNNKSGWTVISSASRDGSTSHGSIYNLPFYGKQRSVDYGKTWFLFDSPISIEIVKKQMGV